jgi:N-acetylglutamate synthase-like GNAT family acetyltransferase
MNLDFRELSLEDLPIIRKLSKSMDMRNDPKIGKTAEALIKDPKCLLYGAFEGSNLVGVGGLREKFENFAWIEDIRVHGKYQKKGVGTALFKHGENLAEEKGFPRVAFQTVTENKGSCRIGEKLGYDRRHEMTAFYMRPSRAPEVEEEYKQQKPVQSKIALDKLTELHEGPKEEICIGWSYSPFEAEYYDTDPEKNFYVSGDTVMLDFIDRSIATGEIDGAKAILYGSKENVSELVYGFFDRNKDLGVILLCLCPEHLIPEVKSLGFKHARVWNWNHNIVVMFDKKLKE